MNGNGNIKKRRVGDGSVEEDTASSELSAIKSLLQEVLNQNRIQTTTIQTMQRDITRLSNKCDRMELTINRVENQQKEQELLEECNNMENRKQTMKIEKLTIKCNQMDKSMSSEFDDLHKRFDDVHKTNNVLKGKLNTLEKSQKKVADRQKYHEMLLQNQKWEYSAPRPSEEYWNSLAETDEDEDEAEQFLQQIQQYTEVMRYGNGEMRYGHGDIELDASVQYYEELLPHWEEFANALEQYQYYLHYLPEETETSLQLSGMELCHEVVDLLSAALESSYFLNITFKNNNFGQYGIDFVLDYVERNKKCKEFCLEGNTIDNMDDINKLCKIVEEHPSIENLTLDNCRGDDIDGSEMLQMIVNAGKNNLEVLTLRNNHISTTEGGIFHCLALNPILGSLYLEWNQLNDQDAIGIAEALKQNTNLRFLHLTNNNNITKTGWAALKKAEFDNSSLNAVADSNHTCAIEYPSDDSDGFFPISDAIKEVVDINISEMNGDRKAKTVFHPPCNRQKKIYSVLSSRNRDCSNVKHFEVTPVLQPKLQDLRRN